MEWAHADYPILEFDPNRSAMIEPRRSRSQKQAAPEAIVQCFFLEVIEEVCGGGRAEEVTAFTWEHGTHRMYAVESQHGTVGVYHPGVGSPMAAGLMEEAIAAGGRCFVACGGAGAVLPGLALGHVVIPTSAVRDEGTSYHYLPPSREIELDGDVASVLESVVADHGVPYEKGRTWSTDAPYRETPGRIAQRRDEGCLTVEMETAALAAVARFRDVRFGQYLYAGDDVSGESWDHRGWNIFSAASDLGQPEGQGHSGTIRSSLFWLAVEAAARLARPA